MKFLSNSRRGKVDANFAGESAAVRKRGDIRYIPRVQRNPNFRLPFLLLHRKLYLRESLCTQSSRSV